MFSIERLSSPLWRRTAVAILLSMMVLVVARGQTESSDSVEPNQQQISDLKKKRIDLLAKRVEMVQPFFEAGLASRDSLYRCKLDLLRCRLEYADQIPDKRKILDEMIRLNGELSEIAQQAVHAPVVPPQSGARPQFKLDPSNDWLAFEAEKARLEIERAKLN